MFSSLRIPVHAGYWLDLGFIIEKKKGVDLPGLGKLQQITYLLHGWPAQTSCGFRIVLEFWNSLWGLGAE
jgi:hypothetical protein